MTVGRSRAPRRATWRGVRALVLALGVALAPGGAAEAPRAPLGRVERPSILVRKAKRELVLLSGTTPVRSYRIGLGAEPVAPKRRQGDNATPEGAYRVCVKNPQSRFTLSLGLSYPGGADADRALAEGRITRRQHERIHAAERRKGIPPWDTPLGGEIFIHGGGSGSDWTWGCVALDDGDVRELYAAVPVGTPVTIEP